MNKMRLLARSGFRQARAQLIVLFCLILIASALLSVWLMLVTDYNRNFEQQHDALHAEHVTCIISAPKQTVEDTLQPVFKERDDIESAEYTAGLIVPVTFPYSGGDFSMPFFVIKEDDALEKEVGRVEIVKEDPSVDGLLFPMIYEGDLQAGKKADLRIGEQTEERWIRGFFNSVMAGSHNCGLTELLASEATYEELEEDGAGSPGTLCSVRVTDLTQCTPVRSKIVQTLSGRFPSAYIVSSAYDHVRVSRYVSSSIASGVFCAAAALLLFVALIIGTSNIAAQIQNAMPNYGILKAAGYTGRMLMWSIVWQYTLVALPAALVGNVAAYILYPGIAASMVLQTGIPYEVHFMVLPVVASIVVCVGAVVLSSWLCARRIEKIDPVLALRSGTTVHSFRKNRFALSRSRASANIAMGLKEAASSLSRNVILCVSMCFLSLLIVLGAVLIQSVFVDAGPLLDLIGLEQVDIDVTITNSEDEGRLLDALGANQAIQRFYLLAEMTTPEPNGPGLTAMVIDSADDLINQSVLFEGRWPKYANEVAMGARHAEDLGYQLGDEVTLGPDGAEHTYLITGLTQLTNYLGDDIWLTREAYEKMMPLTTPKYLGILEEGEDINAIVEDLEDLLSGTSATVTNRRDMVASVVSSYAVAMQLIAVMLLVLCALMTILVIYLIVRTSVQTRLGEYGLLKALGYRTKDLMGQTALALAPALSISTALSLVLWSFAINPIFAAFFHGMGLRQSHFEVPAPLITGLGVTLFLFAIGLALILASRIRKVSPARLLAEE